MSFPLTQTEADDLIKIPKVSDAKKAEIYPGCGDSLRLELRSITKKDTFLIEVTRASIDLAKVNHQLVGRQIIPLVRLDIGESVKHKNPDDVWISGPHLHEYQEGWELKWARPLPVALFDPSDDLLTHLNKFFNFCNVTLPLPVSMGLFS